MAVVTKCRKCGKKKMEYKWQTFKNGEKHIAQICGSCGKFNDYVAKVEPYLSLVSGNYVSEIRKAKHENNICKQA